MNEEWIWLRVYSAIIGVSGGAAQAARAANEAVLAYRKQFPDSSPDQNVPLYRLQGHGDHFYTTSPEERDSAVANYGYTYEGIACYVRTEP